MKEQIKNLGIEILVNTIVLCFMIIFYTAQIEDQNDLIINRIDNMEKIIQKNNQSSSCSKKPILKKLVTATVYCASPEQCNEDFLTTAFMYKLYEKNNFDLKIIAVSRDLLKDFPNETKVKITGAGEYDGIYTVRDKMNKRWKNRIDILIDKNMKQGIWKNVQIKKI